MATLTHIAWKLLSVALSLICLIAVIISLYVVAGLGLASVSDQLKGPILERVEKVIGNEVQAQEIEFGWNKFSPWVRLRKLQVFSGSGFPAVRIDLIEFDINPLHSMRRLTLVANLLRIENADVQLVQNAKGELGLKGGTGELAIDLKPLLEFALDAIVVSIDDVRLRLDSEVPSFEGRFFDMQAAVHVSKDHNWKNLQAKLVRRNSDGGAGKDSDKFTATGRFRGDLRDFDSLKGAFQIQMTAFDLDDWRSPITVANKDLFTVATEAVAIDIQIEPDWVMRGRLRTGGIKGHLLGEQDNPFQIAVGESLVSWQSTSEDNWQLQTRITQGLVDELAFESFSLAMQAKNQKGGERKYWLWIPEMDSEHLRRVALASNIIAPNIRHWLTSIEPRMLVKNLYGRVEHTPDEPVRLALNANLENVQAKAFNAIPFLDGMTGELLAYEGGGRFRTGKAPFVTAFPAIFEAKTPVRNAGGEVIFRFEGDSFFIRGDEITAELDYGFVTGGSFVVNNTADSALRTLSLHLSLVDIDLQEGSVMIPKDLPPDLKIWLRSATKAGIAPNIGAIYHGHLSEHEPFDLSPLGLILNVQDVVFEYDPVWPQIEKARGRAHITETETRINLDAATMFDIDFSNIGIHALVNASKDQPIQVRAHTGARLEKMMTFLRDTPTKDFVEPKILEWQLEGLGSLGVQIAIPVTFGPEGSALDASAVNVILDGTISDTRLYIPTLDLAFTKGQGHLRIDSHKGVFSEGINFDIFNGTSYGTISSDWRDPDNSTVRLDVAGTGEVMKLTRWLDAVSMEILEGELTYQGIMEIDMTPDASFRMDLKSELIGLKVPMPEPFSKVARESRSASVRIDDDGRGTTRLEFDLAPNINGLLEIVDSSLTRGIVQIADKTPLQLPGEKDAGLQVVGAIDRTDFGEWIDYIDVVDALYADYEERTGEEASDTVSLISIEGKLLDVGDFEVTDFSVQGTREGEAWRADVDSAEVTGTFLVYDNDLPVVATLERVSVEIEDPAPEVAIATEAGEESGASVRAVPTEDPMISVDFEDLVPMQVEIKSFNLDNEYYGSWSFELHPETDKVVFVHLSADIRGLLLGDHNEHISQITWQRTPEGDVTSYSGKATATNLGEVLKAWEYPPSLTTQQASIDMDIRWPGSPAMFDWLALKGDVGMDLKRGAVVGLSEGASKAARLIALLDITFWLRRLRLDFADLSTKGVAFDRLGGGLKLNSGLIQVVDPVRVVGPGATLKFSGTADLSESTMDGELVATLPLSKNIPWIAGAVALSNPVTALFAWVAERFLRKPINKLTSIKYRIGGTLEDPVIEFDGMFNDSLSTVKSDAR